MNGYQSVWEDDETNRKVELLVDYSLQGEAITINQITPTRVTFIDPATKSDIRSIGIWTKTGRSMLVQKLRAAGRVDSLQQEIAQRHLATVVQ